MLIELRDCHWATTLNRASFRGEDWLPGADFFFFFFCISRSHSQKFHPIALHVKKTLAVLSLAPGTRTPDDKYGCTIRLQRDGSKLSMQTNSRPWHRADFSDTSAWFLSEMMAVLFWISQFHQSFPDACSALVTDASERLDDVTRGRCRM